MIFKNRDGYLKAFNEDKHIIKGKQIHLRQTHTRKEMKNKRIVSDVGEEEPQNLPPFYNLGPGANIHPDMNNLPPTYNGRGRYPPQQEPFIKSEKFIREPDYFENREDHYYQANSEYGQQPIGFSPMGAYGFDSEHEIRMQPMHYGRSSNKKSGPPIQNSDWSRGYPPHQQHNQAFRGRQPDNRKAYPGQYLPEKDWERRRGGHAGRRNPQMYTERPQNYGHQEQYPMKPHQVPVHREFYSERKLYPPRMERERQGYLPPNHHQNQGNFKGGVKSYGSDMNIGVRGHPNWAPGKRPMYGRGYPPNYAHGNAYGSMRDMYSDSQNLSNPHAQNVFMEGDEEEDVALQRANVPF